MWVWTFNSEHSTLLQSPSATTLFTRISTCIQTSSCNDLTSRCFVRPAAVSATEETTTHQPRRCLLFRQAIPLSLMSVIAASSATLLVTRDWTKYQYYQVETRACRCSCSGQVSTKLGKQLAAPLSVSFCLLEFASISSSSSNFQRERIGKSRQQVAVIWRETHPAACYHIY